jgi:hypothetical protein
VDIHKSNSVPLNAYMDPEYITFWGNLAQELNSGFDLDYLFMELVNEPTPPSRIDTDWYPVQNALVEEIRKYNTDLTIVIAASQVFTAEPGDTAGDDGLNWEQVSNMVRLQMPPDHLQNLVVTYHDYSPKAFTRQSEPRPATFFAEIENLYYPMELKNAQTALLRADHPYAKKNLQTYIDRGWGPAVFEKRFAAVAQWRVSNGNPYIIMGEFGATTKAPDKSSHRYYHDITSIAEKYNVGWAWWFKGDSYSSDMGLGTPLEKYNPDKGNPDSVPAGNFSICRHSNAQCQSTPALLVRGIESGSVQAYSGGVLFDLIGRRLNHPGAVQGQVGYSK